MAFKTINPLRDFLFKLLILILLSGKSVLPNYVGNLSGIILDSETNEPIPNAVMQILDTDVFTTSRLDGTFMLEDLPEGVYKIKVTHIAYKENLVEINLVEKSDKSIKVYLIPNSIEINPVIVTDKSYTSKFDELNEETNTLKGKELQRELGFNLAATLKNETGLSIRSIGPAPARPVIRGLGGNRVLISEDGIESTDLSSTSPDHAVTLEPFSINRIEVLRGPKVLLHTSTTIGGVVNVVREEIPQEKHHEIHGNIGLFGESANNGLLGSIIAEIPVSNFASRFEFSRRSASDMKTPIGELKNSYAHNLNYSAGASYVNDFGFAGFSYRNFELDYGVPGGFVGAHPNGVDITMLRSQINLKSRFNISSEILDNIEMNFSRVFYRHKEFESSGRIGSEFRIINYLGSLNFNHKSLNILEGGTIGSSFEYRDFNIGGFVFTSPTKSLNISAYFFESISAAPFTFEFAARYNFDNIMPIEEKLNTGIGDIKERIFNTFSLSFSALYQVSDVVYFGGNISKSSRVPTIEELFSEGPHLAAYSYEIGNPLLEPESGIGSEIFIYHNFKDINYNITFFYNDITNYIIPRNTGEINYSTFLPIYATTGVNAVLYGAEHQLDWKISNSFTLTNSISYTNGKIKTSKTNLPQIPPLKGNIQLKYSYNNLIIGTTAEYAAEQRKVDLFEEPTAGYLILNSFVQYSFLTGKFIHNFSLSADNIFNKEYRNHLSRVKVILPEAGRNFRLTYRTYF